MDPILVRPSFRAIVSSGVGVLLSVWLAASPAAAASVTKVVGADGDVKTFGTDEIDTVDDRLHLTQSGGLERRVILEFDLTGIPVGSALQTAELAIVKDGTMSNTGGAPIPIHLWVRPGDGVIDIADYGGVSVNVGDYSEPLGAANGTEFVWPLAVAPIQDAFDFSVGPITLRIETDNFAIFEFVSLETATAFAPAEIRINYSPPAPAPVPGLRGPGLALLVASLLAVGAVGARRTRLAA